MPGTAEPPQPNRPRPKHQHPRPNHPLLPPAADRRWGGGGGRPLINRGDALPALPGKQREPLSPGLSLSLWVVRKTPGEDGSAPPGEAEVPVGSPLFPSLVLMLTPTCTYTPSPTCHAHPADKSWALHGCRGLRGPQGWKTPSCEDWGRAALPTQAPGLAQTKRPFHWPAFQGHSSKSSSWRLEVGGRRVAEGSPVPPSTAVPKVRKARTRPGRASQGVFARTRLHGQERRSQ